MPVKPVLISVTGPTASGKTAMGVFLARLLGTEVVSADSRQVYRGMSVGTAAPTDAEMQGVRHHLIGILDPSEDYSAGKFRERAIDALREIWTRHPVAIVVGGSGLYLRALWEGFDDIPPVAPEVRSSLQLEWETNGLNALVDELTAKDPLTASRTDLSNPRRVLRALEVIRSSGRPLSEFQQKKMKMKEPEWTEIRIGLDPGREELYRRINQRVEEMVKSGLEEEARQLFRKFGKNQNSLLTVGYQEWLPCFEGKISREAAIAGIKQATRNYARRQMTWFRKTEGIRWFAPGQFQEVADFVQEELRRMENPLPQ